MKKFLLSFLGFATALSCFSQGNADCATYSHDVSITPGFELTANTITSKKGHYDMSWIDEAARGKRVVMIGENHWMNAVHRTARDLVFHLNTIDDFPVLVKEVPYSTTPFVNAYINCKSDTCDKVLDVLKPYFGSKEELDFLKEVQQWNTNHPEKKITIVCSDFEQEFNFSLRNVFSPFFTQQGHKNFRDKVISFKNNTVALIGYMDSLAHEAPARFHVKDRPYLNKQFVLNVLDNLSAFDQASTAFRVYKEMGMSESEAFAMREKARTRAIINNLTDDSKFGKLLRRDKFILWGGADHTRTYQLTNDNFHKYEGWFLANEYGITRNKVLSIRITNLSYSIPDQYFTNDSYLNGTGQFARLVEAYKRCNEGQQKQVYKMIEEQTDVINAVRFAFKLNKDQPVWFEGNEQMKKLLRKSRKLKDDAQLKRFYSHDYVIVLPSSNLYAWSNS
ncbi:hypothetical protein H8S95_13810 [Pontibacter sp. KCTC 32443]|uniref:hypothetical protein n=1 Tax=Pontibacter TaxID=323449 RepID=UPI00164ED06A|nr:MULTISPECIES: hypothetical protein [Pontibacter]MBC5775149.1 hypothetical protein [Pontibacter sp. KCTC 32443]